MIHKVYLETSVISYLTARPSRDLIVAAHQELTFEWWTQHRSRFNLFVSELVLQEARRGDPEMARRRLTDLRGVAVLEVNPAAEELVTRIIASALIPAKALDDAFHIAIATVHGADFLLTWNCRHIANAVTAGRLASLCDDVGYQMPLLCTPEQLMGY